MLSNSKMNISKKINNFLLNNRHLRLINTRNKSQTSSEYCLGSVKKYDYENFICTLLLESTSRSCALAIRGFNIEVARVAEQVSQEPIGLMRLKFWEETLDKCYLKDPKKVPHHPVAVELYKALTKRKLTKRYFSNLIKARQLHFNLSSFNSLEDMEKYAEQTVSSVNYLVLEGCDVKNVNADHAASHLGKAQGIVQHLRSLPIARQINFIALPQDLLVKNNISQEEIIRQKNSKKLSDCTYEIASRAHQHLTKARNLMENVPKEGRPALLPAVPIGQFLDHLQAVDYDIFHPSLKYRSWKLLPQLWFTKLRNKY